MQISNQNNLMRHTLFVVLGLLLTAATSATADNFQAGRQAYKNGEYELAERIWRPLAEDGQAAAQLAYGLLHYHGRAVKREPRKALGWITRAAEQELLAAQVVLGEMYFTGDGVARDYATASRWFRKAAHQGNPFAQNAVGVMHRDSLGVPTNLVRAYAWFDLAARLGNTTAATNRDEIARKIPKRYIEQAEALAADWANHR